MEDPLEEKKEKEEEKLDVPDPTNDEKDVNIIAKGDVKIPIKYKSIKRAKVL